MNIKTNQTNFKYTSNRLFSGYIAYWKIFFQTISNIYNSKILTKKMKTQLITRLIILRGVWYLFIKPIGFVISLRNILEGTKVIHEGYKNMDTVKGKKTFIIYLFRKIPIFYIKKQFSPKDILEVLSK